MAYKYQPIKDEIFASDDEGEVEELDEENGDQAVEDSILSTLVEDPISPPKGSSISLMDSPTKVERVTREILSNTPKVLPPNSKVKQVIEQDGVLILETVETDPNDPEALPLGSTVIASGNDHDNTLGDADLTMDTTMDDSSLDDSAILAELEDSTAMDMKPGGADDDVPRESCHICGKQVMHLDKHILSNHGEKVECQLCNQTFPVGNLRWHILKEHCHNKVRN